VTKAERRAAIHLEVVRLMADKRKRRGFSMNRVAYMSGLNQSTVSRLEKNPENPTMDSLLRVAEVLELNLGDVLKRAIKNVEKRACGKVS
jgi:transcriptional regulator with XRE-family HTH domain